LDHDSCRWFKSMSRQGIRGPWQQYPRYYPHCHPIYRYITFSLSLDFLRRRMMAAIPSPPKPVARSTNEAGSGTRGPPTVLAFAVAGKNMAAIIQYTDFIHPSVGPETATTLTKHDSYHECKILKTKLRQSRGCGMIMISCS